MTQHTNSSSSEQREPIGIARDFHRLKKDGSMTLAEMREFIRQLHGRNPSEVLGIVSGNALIRALGESVLYLGLALVVLTVVPFLMAGDDKESASKKTVEVNTETADAESSVTDAPAAGTTATAASPDGSITAADAEKAVKVMGLGDTKTADPKKNPLDNLDNLLDDVK